MCGGGPPPGGTIASIAKYAPPVSSPVTRKRYASPGPQKASPLSDGRWSRRGAGCVSVGKAGSSLSGGCRINDLEKVQERGHAAQGACRSAAVRAAVPRPRHLTSSVCDIVVGWTRQTSRYVPGTCGVTL